MEQEPIRVILADDNVRFCDTVLRYLQMQEDIDVIETVHNGMDAYEKIKALKPDVAILDGAMPLLDGLGILEKLNDEEFRPICIMLSSLRHENVTQYAYSLGAEYYIIKPFEMHTLAQRIRMFRNIKPSKSENTDLNTEKQGSAINLEQRITNIFHEINIPTRIRGYNYMRMAIIMAVNNPEILYYVTKELYPSVAQKYNATPSSVERAIRNAIDVAWKCGKKETIKKIFGYAFGQCEGKPTNSEFIAFIADRLRLEASR